MTIRLASPDLCIASSTIDELKRGKTFLARLTGPGIDSVKRFSMIEVGSVPMIADCVTGTIYDADGHHHSSTSLRVCDFPQVTPSDIPLWLRACKEVVA